MVATVSDGRKDGRQAGSHRFAGIDRATVGPSLLVLALAVLMSVVLPLINESTPYRHPIRRGDVAELASGITLVPAPGWNLASGALAGHTRSVVGDTNTTELVDGAVDLQVQVAPFAGTPLALLTRVKSISAKLDHARGSAPATRSYRVRTRQGTVGVGQNFIGTARQGTVVAFVLRPPRQASREGVEVVVAGPKGQIARARDDIVAMIRSIRRTS